MSKKLLLILKFVFFLAVIVLISKSYLWFVAGGLQNLPQWEDIQYLIMGDDEDREDIIAVDLLEDDIEESDAEFILNYGVPTHITMSSVNIDLPVEIGAYDFENQVWTISKGKAFYANLSDFPSETGSNTVIYAHNQWTEFSKTKDLEVGDKIIVETDKGNILTYEYVFDELVDPSWGELFTQEVETSRLTLITCNGANDEYRKLIYADLIFSSLSDEYIASLEITENSENTEGEDENINMENDVLEEENEKISETEVPSEEEIINESEEENIVEESVVEEIVPVWTQISLEQLVYGRPLSINFKDLGLMGSIRLGNLSIEDLNVSTINNSTFSIANDSNFIQDGDSKVIIYINLETLSSVTVGSTFSVTTHANQKVVYEVKSNEIVSDLDSIENDSFNIVVNDNGSLRLITAEVSQVLSMQ